MLYRVDQTAAGVTVLLQSRMTLDPPRLPPGFAHAGSRDLAPLLACFSGGMRVRYRIVAKDEKRQTHRTQDPWRAPPARRSGRGSMVEP